MYIVLVFEHFIEKCIDFIVMYIIFSKYFSVIKNSNISQKKKNHIWIRNFIYILLKSHFSNSIISLNIRNNYRKYDKNEGEKSFNKFDLSFFLLNIFLQLSAYNSNHTWSTLNSKAASILDRLSNVMIYYWVQMYYKYITILRKGKLSNLCARYPAYMCPGSFSNLKMQIFSVKLYCIRVIADFIF